MKNLIYLILLGFIASTSFGQSKLSKLHSKTNLDCSICHECETPTKTNPCLASCPRENRKARNYKITDAPNLFVINNIHGEKDIYGAVNLSHKIHAEMAEMSGGCETCHHYNPPSEIVKCSTCHETDRKEVNVNMPDLKSAYHRQCMDCHAEWEEESRCENCHTLNDDYKSAIEDQAHIVFKNLAAIAAEAGTTLDNAVKTTVFLADINNFQAVNGVYAEYFKKPFPARSAFQVAALPLGAALEVEAIFQL